MIEPDSRVRWSTLCWIAVIFSAVSMLAYLASDFRGSGDFFIVNECSHTVEISATRLERPTNWYSLGAGVGVGPVPDGMSVHVRTPGSEAFVTLNVGRFGWVRPGDVTIAGKDCPPASQ